jgi:S-methyl-5-thioribose-1-phosphate isomerase
MRVGDRDLRAVWWTEDGVGFIDQRRLPAALEFARAADVEQVARAIEAVRGAPAIGVLAAYGLALAARRAEPLAGAAARLLRTRPTAVNLRAALEAVRAAGPDPGAVLAAARAWDEAEVAAAAAIGGHGLALLRPRVRVLTHCNAGWLAVQDWGTALAPVYRAAQAGFDPFVLVSETRPRLQGARLTAWELGQAGVRHAIVVDGAAAHFLQRGEVDIVLTGADRIAANGDAANKIGTYAKALAARAHEVPFHVCAPRSTIDRDTPAGAGIPIEERDADEVLTVEGADETGATRRVRVAPAGSPARNPAFDVTPHRLITGLVTEAGRFPATAAGVAAALAAAGPRP